MSDTTNQAASLPAEWQGFNGGVWTESIDVRDFIQQNYTPYEGDESFLTGPTTRTDALWDKVKLLMKQEIEAGGVLAADEEVVSSIVSHAAGYIDKDLETIVGLQTDKPLKRAFMPYGGIKLAVKACNTYGYEPDPLLVDIFTVLNFNL